MATYFVLASAKAPEHCAIFDYLDPFEDIDLPAEGSRVGSRYPSGVRFQMAAEVAGLQVTDVLRNALGYLMISSKLKNLLEKHSTAEIEFLPFTLLNHKGRVAARECHIANVIGTVECVDLARTEGSPSEIDPGEMLRITRLHLLPERIVPARDLFRIASQPRTLLVREDLRQVLEAEGITGARFLALGEPVDLR
jgi:hypothetical protein